MTVSAALPFDVSALIALPPPISTNNLFVNLPGDKSKGQRGGRVKSKDYTSWQRSAAEWIASQQPQSFTGPVAITLYVGQVGVGQGFDIGNAEKAYTDALVAAKVIIDDRMKWVRRIAVVWTPGLRGTVAHLRPAPPDPDLGPILERLGRTGRELVCG